jgi:hypothetical protein
MSPVAKEESYFLTMKSRAQNLPEQITQRGGGVVPKQSVPLGRSSELFSLIPRRVFEVQL